MMKRFSRLMACATVVLVTVGKAEAQWTEPLQLHILEDESIKTWPSINATGATLYYAKVGAGGNENICYSYRIDDTTWSAPFFVCYTPEREISPSIGPGDSVLYFVAYGRPGGYGSYDIWFLRRGPDGEWMEPENPGPNINTAGMEWGVFLSRDGQRLYFSSTRHGGTGLDIFVSQKEGDSWGPATMLPGEINYILNEEHVTLPANESFLILTSWRYAPTGVDLWRCDFNDGVWSAPQPINELNYVRHENGASLSPDGLTVYFASERNDSMPYNSQIYVSHRMSPTGPFPASGGRTRRLQIFPNPVNGKEFMLALPNDMQGGQTELRLFNLLGQQITIYPSRIEQSSMGGRRMRISFDELGTGKYWLLVQSPRFDEVVPLTILK
jgi:hypothetical protein